MDGKKNLTYSTIDVKNQLKLFLLTSARDFGMLQSNQKYFWSFMKSLTALVSNN